ncbi:hypothetical protein HXX76_001559 [Chlamydomonas incerta]|uniref:S-acyltransferase n=1 Tax=Chlamydomonas incerta TaxID=51695 RepID=A0A836B1K6_CHLIN|nr:hypothetical protein HXX76_001559 [Chlamydomonas incerta]|eukprot:KAG2444817.1 hypothetical protein HXX76_001559 [Chlamydomonas incerta]
MGARPRGRSWDELAAPAVWWLLHALGLWACLTLPTDLRLGTQSQLSAQHWVVAVALGINVVFFYTVRRSDPGYLLPQPQLLACEAAPLLAAKAARAAAAAAAAAPGAAEGAGRPQLGSEAEADKDRSATSVPGGVAASADAAESGTKAATVGAAGPAGGQKPGNSSSSSAAGEGRGAGRYGGRYAGGGSSSCSSSAPCSQCGAVRSLEREGEEADDVGCGRNAVVVHCRYCDRCVQGFDHHCWWLGVCVGARNHHYFTRYAASQALVCLLGAHYALTACGRGGPGGHSWAYLALALLGGTFILLGCLVATHTFLVVTGQSGRQALRRNCVWLCCGVRPGWLVRSGGVQRAGRLLFRLVNNDMYSCC